jgi:hypothetical protein
MAEGRKPIFHNEGWLRRLYSCESGSNSPFPISPHLVAPAYLIRSTSAMAEPSSSSFEKFYEDERKLAIKWISAKSNYEPSPMTMARMLKKIKDYNIR